MTSAAKRPITKHSAPQPLKGAKMSAHSRAILAMPLPLRIALFFLLWFETARCFGLSVDGAFVVSLLLAYGTRLVACFSIEIAGFEEELSSLLIAWGIIWVAIYLWLAPRLVRDLPLSFVICAVIALVLAGQRAFHVCLHNPDLLSKAWLRERSEGVLGAVFAALGAAFLTEQLWGSFLPLFGYAALVCLPVAFGWRRGARGASRPYEARFGERQTYQDAGVSEDQ
jgi:hypothetical protein